MNDFAKPLRLVMPPRLQTARRRCTQQQRADKFEEDLNGLRAKLKGHEESSQKLVQRQQQLASMRKQLKAKEDELENYKQTAGGASEVDALRANSRAMRSVLPLWRVVSPPHKLVVVLPQQAWRENYPSSDSVPPAKQLT